MYRKKFEAIAKELKYFLPKKLLPDPRSEILDLKSWIQDPGSEIRKKNLSPIRILGQKTLDLDPQRWS
jgi:hypothetical protein